jgi:hypothetical protein
MYVPTGQGHQVRIRVTGERARAGGKVGVRDSRRAVLLGDRAHFVHLMRGAGRGRGALARVSLLFGSRSQG